jgi:hypothetical protein
MSKIERIPTRWATGVNYSSGPDTGSPTKLDPSSEANGFIRGVVAAPQHVNFHLNALAAAARRQFEVNALHLRLQENIGDAINDTATSMAVTQVDGIGNPTGPVLLVKAGSNDVLHAFNGDPKLNDANGSVASITSAVREAATDGARVVVVGTGGNKNSYTDDYGDTWSAGAVGIDVCEYLVHNGTNFVGGGAASNSAFSSPDAATPWASAATGFSAVSGLAVIGDASDTVVCLGNSGIQPRFSRSTDDGATFSGSVAPPDAATAEEPGSLAGCPLAPNGSVVYHVMRCNAGARLRVNTSPDGVNWTQSAVIEAPAGTDFSSTPRILACKSSGLLVIAAPATDLTNSTVQLYASLNGTDWVGPATARSISVNTFGVAGGRLFQCRNTEMYASDGIGVV